MTMQGITPLTPTAPKAAPPVPAIPFGYARARLMASDRRRCQKAIEHGFDRWIEEFNKRQKFMEKAFGWRRNPNRAQRLAAYLKKPWVAWDEQKQKFPRDWEEDHNDFQELRQAAADGEFEDEEMAAARVWAQAEIARVMAMPAIQPEVPQ